jgi:hypothetical protein
VKNQLSHVQFYQLCKHLTDTKDEWNNCGLSLQDSAKKISSQMGFSVSKEAVKRAQQVTGVKWQGRTGPRRASSSLPPGALYKMEIMRRELVALLRQLNHPVPEEMGQSFINNGEALSEEDQE